MTGVFWVVWPSSSKGLDPNPLGIVPMSRMFMSSAAIISPNLPPKGEPPCWTVLAFIGELNITPIYHVLDEKGPDHNKCFESEVVISERHFPSGWGTTKKQAEQKAAFNALVELGVLEEALPGDSK